MADLLHKGNSKYAKNEELTKGVDKFVIMISDITPDAPHMPGTFFNCIFKPLCDQNKLKFDDMDWCEKDTSEIFAYDGHFKFFLYMLQWKSK